MASVHRVAVTGVPDWLPSERLLGPGFARDHSAWVAELGAPIAADVVARLRGVSIGASPIEIEVRPALSRGVVRAGRLRDARARRHTTPGFTRPNARLDDEGRWSLTPESLALAIGKKARERRVIDATCGCGGNAIGFARAGCAVTAIDRNPGRLDLARHNAALYGVSIQFLLGDAVDLLPRLESDLVFVDPPWGRGWARDRTSLSDVPLLASLLPHCRAEVWAKLPPSFDPGEWPGAAPSAWFGSVEGDFRRVKFLLLQR